MRVFGSPPPRHCSFTTAKDAQEAPSASADEKCRAAGSLVLLPSAGSEGTDRLAPGAYSYLNAQSTLAALALVGPLAALSVWIMSGTVRTLVLIGLAMMFIVGLLIEVTVVNRLKVARTSYTVTADYIYIMRGRLFRRAVTVATARVLNVECVQGPLLRTFGLMTVKFACLSTVVALGPLAPAHANEIRGTVLGAASQHA